MFTCADRVLDGRALVESDLVVAADGADGTAVSGAQHRTVGGSRTLAAHRVVAGRTGAGRAVAVRAQIARPATHDGHRWRRSGRRRRAVFVTGVRSGRLRLGIRHLWLRLRMGRRLVADHLVTNVLVKVAIAFAFRVVSGVTFTLDATVGRARPARPTRRMAAASVAERHTGNARLADRVLVVDDVTATTTGLVPVQIADRHRPTQSHHSPTGWTF